MANTTPQTLAWYDREATSPPFDPDGMCLKVCRTARGIDALYPSALAAQSATPKEDRVSDLADIVPGLILYFDDPRDSNPYGHIVTVDDVSDRVKSLSDVVVWTNSVKSNILVKVRADYFPRYWGDGFVYGAKSLNGVKLDLGESIAPPPRPALTGGKFVVAALADLERARSIHHSKGHIRMERALARDIKAMKLRYNIK